ncbi:hypothetical protein Tco_0622649 [Tanacetum coccineum]
MSKSTVIFLILFSSTISLFTSLSTLNPTRNKCPLADTDYEEGEIVDSLLVTVISLELTTLRVIALYWYNVGQNAIKHILRILPYDFMTSSLSLIHILRCFELASGLKVNIDKSRVMGVGVPTSEVISMASSIGCTHDSLPFCYLGLPVGKWMNLSASWNEVINRFRDKLSSWKAKSLSIGGRLTLVMAVLGSLPVYYFSLFKAPQKIINTLESIRSRFFWGFSDSQKGISWVKWNCILLGKDKGGLGVGSLISKNIGLLWKWKWRFLVEKKYPLAHRYRGILW